MNNNAPIYVVAEMACSHDGQEEIAKQIILSAAQCKADAIQFQVWTLKQLMTPTHPDFPKLSKLELGEKAWERLFHFTRTYCPDLEIVGCPYDLSSLTLCSTLGADRIKIHSGEISNDELIKATAQTRKPVHLCTGATTTEEVWSAIRILERNQSGPISLLYGIQSHPTPIDKANLLGISDLARRFNLPVGYQDHSPGETECGPWLSATAIGLGARIIETHIVDNRSRCQTDAEAALEPEEFATLIKMIRSIESSLGRPQNNQFSKTEREYRKLSRRTLIAALDLKPGDTLSVDSISTLRSEQPGLDLSTLNETLGKIIKQPVKQFESIGIEDLI